MKHTKMKPTKENTRFRWSRYFGNDEYAAVRLYCCGDGAAAKITRSRYLTPEELADVGKWFQKVARALKGLRASKASAINARKSRSKGAA